MSKIQDALRKLQQESGTRATPNAIDGSKKAERRGVESGTESAILARLVTRQSVRGDSAVDDRSESDVLVQIDQQALRDAGLIAPEYHERLLADQYREIKRPLIANAYGKRANRVEDGNLIMISSALAGEGKTFTTINLALSMSKEKDYSVLLIDTDVAKPHISDVFGIAESKGLLDLLDDKNLNLNSVILPTNIAGLSIMPAGAPRDSATELLASSRMKEVVMAIRDRNDKSLILFDSPPLLQTTEAKVLAGLVGQIVLVVRAEETPQGAVMAAVDSLDKDKPINLILNQARSGSDASHYGYGFNYGSAYKRSNNPGKPDQSDADIWK